MTPSIAQLRGDAGEFEPRMVEEPAYLAVIDDAVAALGERGIAFVFIGGLASTVYGRPRWTKDADVLVRPEDARAALDALAEAGFKTEETDAAWLYKAIKRGTLVDVIFRSRGDVYLDAEMFSRSREIEFKGRRLRLIPPEDLIVCKAIVHEEPMPHHWYDGLGILANQEIDWDYLVTRAMQHGARRVLGMLVYAQSNDIAVPSKAISALYHAIYEA